MKKFIFSNILWGAALTLATLFFYFAGTGLEPLELKFYDFRSQLNARTVTENELAIIEINDDSISKIGRWPWPRSKMAEMLTWLSTDSAKPSVIGLNILFSEPETNKDIEVTERLRLKYQELVAAKKIKETTQESEFEKILAETRRDMDNDAKLAAAISGIGNVVLPMFFATDELASKPRPEPDWLKKFAADVAQDPAALDLLPEGSALTLPLEILAYPAAGIGHVNVFNDTDGTVRKESPFIPYNQSFYPSFAAEIARNHLELPSAESVITPGRFFRIGKRQIPLDPASSLLIAFNKSHTSFKYYSFYDVLNGKVVPEAFKDKIVLIGLTAQGVGSLYVTPVGKNLPAVEFSANVIENILHSHFITRPDWAAQTELALIVFTGLFITFVLARLKAGLGAVCAAVILAALIGSGIYLFASKGLWVKIMYPVFLMVSGYIFIISKRFFTTEKKKELIEGSAIETNKMLGLSFQGQGMLDLAFEKFRNCPVDDAMKELLYNLALDFERKRQFNKAVAVYGHIATTDPKYKDIQGKIEMLTKASDGAVFGGAIGGAKGGDATMLVAGSSTVPTLGRYEVTKELGKGAMGIVYLGRDPKINRTVAIKTMRFEEGLEETAMKELKDRFFREAQAAGNLTHPNIVKIYDAGEEQDIAYIAMELLKGDDLKKWTPKSNLLPVPKVLEYMAISAEALSYAHENGVIHRDIKPANIMLLDNGALRVADFGIARITESSKTATGTVLGTPYYMSPEQIAGKKVDGRADLFALGVTMYELLTGERPWKGGESVGTLFFQITSDPYPDPLIIRADLPKEILPVIDKALKKNPDERYQTGAEMGADIRRILEKKPGPGAETPADKPAAAPAAKPAQPPPAPKPRPAPLGAPPQAQNAKPSPAPAPQAAPAPAPHPQPQTKASAPAPQTLSPSATPHGGSPPILPGGHSAGLFSATLPGGPAGLFGGGGGGQPSKKTGPVPPGTPKTQPKETIQPTIAPAPLGAPPLSAEVNKIELEPQTDIQTSGSQPSVSIPHPSSLIPHPSVEPPEPAPLISRPEVIIKDTIQQPITEALAQPQTPILKAPAAPPAAGGDDKAAADLPAGQARLPPPNNPAGPPSSMAENEQTGAAQPTGGQAGKPKTAPPPDFEKTLPLIYPGEEKK
ncbi:MAG: CHASE2 domain-containing protein [Elusimicrobia bacterium]|nr:CHASE2 domain-containing protein [Elusimicrobiota bacterium]